MAALRNAGLRAVLALSVSCLLWGAPASAAERLGPGPEGWAGDLSPISADQWSYDRAYHLLERAGFGGTPADVARLAAMTPEDAVSALVDYEGIDDSTLPAFDDSGAFTADMEPFPASRADAVRMARADGEAMGVKVKPGGDRPLQPVVNRFFYWLRANRLESVRAGQWWADRMVATPRPLEEKMALFWHGHFATSSDKVRDYRKMLQQRDLFARYATGNFRDLAVAVAKNPAMLVYLDAAQNVKALPNENFGREVLELFTMGIGNYSETDIREASRAFTGWTNDSMTFVVDEANHDEGEKTFLGKTGNFDGADIIDIALEKKSSARFIAGKLYRFFVSDEPNEAAIDGLAAVLYDNGYEIEPLLRTMFLSKDFYAPKSYASKVKGPVELVVSSCRKLGLDHVPGIPDFNETTYALGQELFYPPNVAGWAGGRSWVTPATLVDRGNFARSLLFPDIGAFKAPDRELPSIYREVADKIAEGYDITSATVEGKTMSMANEMAAADEDYNTRYGGYHGYVVAFERVKPIPRVPAEIDFTAMIDAAGLKTTEAVVDHFLTRLLSVPLAPGQRQAMVDFLTHELGTETVAEATSYLEEPVRALVHLIMSTPEFQLS